MMDLLTDKSFSGKLEIEEIHYERPKGVWKRICLLFFEKDDF